MNYHIKTVANWGGIAMRFISGTITWFIAAFVVQLVWNSIVLVRFPDLPKVTYWEWFWVRVGLAFLLPHGMFSTGGHDFKPKVERGEP